MNKNRRTIYLDPATAAIIAAHTHPGQSRSDVIREMAHQLDGILAATPPAQFTEEELAVLADAIDPRSWNWREFRNDFLGRCMGWLYLESGLAKDAADNLVARLQPLTYAQCLELLLRLQRRDGVLEPELLDDGPASTTSSPGVPPSCVNAGPSSNSSGSSAPVRRCRMRSSVTACG